MAEMRETLTVPDGCRLVALVTGRPESDEETLAGLRGTDSRFYATDEPDVALEALSEETRLVVCDVQNEALDLDAFVAALDPGPTLLLLLGAGGSPDESAAGGAAVEHFLSRPFRAETLAALCRALLEATDGDDALAARDAGPALRLRAPSRFSARPLYTEATRFVEGVLRRAVHAEPADVEGARVVAERLQTSLMQSNQLLLRALEPYDRFELAPHCTNVAVIAGKIAMSLDGSLEDTRKAVQAGLLHDVGMSRLAPDILEKKGPLTDEEWKEVRRHPVYGPELIADTEADVEWLRRAIGQEHERLDGSGYPAGLEGDAIDPLARILGVADVFEAFCHARSYRSPFTAYEALERVIGMRGVRLDADVVDALSAEISVFPLDSYVQLDSGEIARVVETNPGNLMRPVVEVLWDASWEPVHPPRRVELAEAPSVSIASPLHESEVPIT